MFFIIIFQRSLLSSNQKKLFKPIFKKTIVNVFSSTKKIIISKSSPLSTKSTFKKAIISDFTSSTKSIKSIFINSKNKLSNSTSIQFFVVVISQTRILSPLSKINLVSNIIMSNLSPLLSKTDFVSNTNRFLSLLSKIDLASNTGRFLPLLLEIDFVDDFNINVMIFRRSNRLQK